MRLLLASDHAGFEQKESLKEFLRSEGHEVEDLGPQSDDRVDYPDYARELCQQLISSQEEGSAPYDKGVLVCGSGIGMAIAANKMPKIRASLITSTEFAKYSRLHNDLNVITLAGRLGDLEENKEILKVWLSTEFEGGRHAERVEKIMQLEKRCCCHD